MWPYDRAMSRIPYGAADLHAHSRVSDGTQSPSDLVDAALRAGLGTVALTDHDSTAGWSEAQRRAEEVGIGLVPGMELSTRLNHQSVHVLGYLFNPDDPTLLAETERIRTSRLTRAEGIVGRIGADYPLTWDAVLEIAGTGATVGRPHIADALVAAGIVSDRAEAFGGILHPSRGYVFPHYAPDPMVGVQAIRAAGGVSVIAHPVTHGRDNVLTDAYLERLVDAGLGGVEIEHRENTDEGKARLRDLAARHDLIVTGSSDYHGAGKPNRLGENTTERAMLERIAESATGHEPVFPG